jgi:hypothetical protein
MAGDATSALARPPNPWLHFTPPASGSEILGHAAAPASRIIWQGHSGEFLKMFLSGPKPGAKRHARGLCRDAPACVHLAAAYHGQKGENHSMKVVRGLPHATNVDAEHVRSTTTYTYCNTSSPRRHPHRCCHRRRRRRASAVWGMPSTPTSGSCA